MANLLFRGLSSIAISMGSWRSLVVQNPSRSKESLHYYNFGLVDARQDTIKAYGEEAFLMRGRVPPHLKVVSFVDYSGITDTHVSEFFLEQVLRDCNFSSFTRPSIALAVSRHLSPVSLKFFTDVIYEAGGKLDVLLDQSLLKAVSERPIEQIPALMVMDIGATKTEMSLVSVGKVVQWQMTRLGSVDLDQLITDYLRRVHFLAIGPQTAESLKRQMGEEQFRDEDLELQCFGKDILTGQPRKMTFAREELFEVVKPWLEQICLFMKACVEMVAPELVDETLKQGVLLTGGGANTAQLSDYILKLTGVQARVAKRPATSIADGLIKAFQEPELWNSAVIDRAFFG